MQGGEGAAMGSQQKEKSPTSLADINTIREAALRAQSTTSPVNTPNPLASCIYPADWFISQSSVDESASMLLTSGLGD